MIKVLFFGPVAERVGASELQVQFNAGMRLAGSARAIAGHLSGGVRDRVFRGGERRRMRWICPLPLKDGSEVVFMSKYSGG